MLAWMLIVAGTNVLTGMLWFEIGNWWGLKRAGKLVKDTLEKSQALEMNLDRLMRAVRRYSMEHQDGQGSPTEVPGNLPEETQEP